MKYILRHIDKSPVYIALCYEAGGIFQAENKLGVAHLTEHIIMSKNILNNFNICAQTEDRFMSFFAVVLNPDRHNIESAIYAMSQLIGNLKISEKTLIEEKNAIKNEVSNFSYDYPNTNEVILHDYLFTNVIRERNFEIITGNTLDPGKDITLKDIRKHIKDNLSHPYLAIITGDFDKDNAKKILNKYFPHKKQQKTESLAVNLPSKHKMKYITDKTKNREILNTYYGIGWSILTIDQKEIVALLVAFKAISNPKNELYHILRVKNGLIYHFCMDQSYITGKLNLSIHTSFDKKAGQNEITKLILKFITSDKKILKSINNQLSLEKESSLILYDGSRTTYSNQYYFSKLDLTIETYAQQVDLLTPNEIMIIFRKYIKSEDSTILIS